MVENQKDYEEGLFVESHYKFETIELKKRSIGEMEKIFEQQVDTIPLSLKIFYAIPFFSKMSCLVILR